MAAIAGYGNCQRLLSFRFQQAFIRLVACPMPLRAINTEGR